MACNPACAWDIGPHQRPATEMRRPQISPTNPLHVDGGQPPYRNISTMLGIRVMLYDMREHRPERPNHHRPTDRPDDQPTNPNRPEGPRPRHQRARTPEPARPNPPAPHQAPNTAPPNPDHPARPHTKTPTQAEEAIRRQSGDCLRSFTPGFAQGYCLSLALRGAGYPWTQKTKRPGGGRCSPGIVGWPMFPHPWHKIFDIQQTAYQRRA